MQRTLTMTLLNELRSLGYTFFLSRTNCIVGLDADVCITLMPVRSEPDVAHLPENFDTYFDIEEEPVQLAQGVDDTIVLVDLSSVDLHFFIEDYI